MTPIESKLNLTPAEQGLKGCLNKLEELKSEINDIFAPRQFTNPRNPECHYFSTGPEIWNQCQGQVDVFVTGVGSEGGR